MIKYLQLDYKLKITFLGFGDYDTDLAKHMCLFVYIVIVKETLIEHGKRLFCNGCSFGF